MIPDANWSPTLLDRVSAWLLYLSQTVHDPLLTSLTASITLPPLPSSGIMKKLFDVFCAHTYPIKIVEMMSNAR